MQNIMLYAKYYLQLSNQQTSVIMLLCFVDCHTTRSINKVCHIIAAICWLCYET